MADGWKCPNCGKAHGPHVDTCPAAATSPEVRPLLPDAPLPAIPTGPRTWPFGAPWRPYIRAACVTPSVSAAPLGIQIWN